MKRCIIAAALAGAVIVPASVLAAPLHPLPDATNAAPMAGFDRGYWKAEYRPWFPVAPRWDDDQGDRRGDYKRSKNRHGDGDRDRRDGDRSARNAPRETYDGPNGENCAMWDNSCRR